MTAILCAVDSTVPLFAADQAQEAYRRLRNELAGLVALRVISGDEVTRLDAVLSDVATKIERHNRGARRTNHQRGERCAAM